jgi:hypothetical protein
MRSAWGSPCSTPREQDGRLSRGEARKGVEASASGHVSDLMHTVCRLGWAYSEVGRLSEARETLAALADLRAKRLGEDHRDSLDTREALIKVIMKQGEPALAEAMLRQLQRDREAHLGPRDRDTLETDRLRAITLTALDRRREARSLLSRLLQIQEQVLGERHHDVVKVREHLRDLGRQL